MEKALGIQVSAKAISILRISLVDQKQSILFSLTDEMFKINYKRDSKEHEIVDQRSQNMMDAKLNLKWTAPEWN